MSQLFSEVSISRKRTLDLVNQVVIPTVQRIEDCMKKHGYPVDRRLDLDVLHRLSLYAIAVAYKPKKAEPCLRAFVEKYCKLKVKKGDCAAIWEDFGFHLLQWLREAERQSQKWKKYKARVQQIPDWYQLQTQFCENTDETEEQEGFWVEDSADAAVDMTHLHTSDDAFKVISAQEFMAEANLDSGFLQDLQHDLEDIHNILETAESLDDFIADRFILDLSKLSGTLHHSIEFESLGIVLEHLMSLVRNLVTQLDESHKMLLVQLLMQLVEDLMDWFDHIFIVQDAIDIHYLDAALMASISQIEVLFEADSAETPQAEGEDGDFMLF